MKPDAQRELIPRNTTLHLIDALNVMTAKLLGAAEQWQLLDNTGRVPPAPSYAELLQHATDAQALSRDVLQLTTDFARTSHSTNRAGRAVLAHLAIAATMSSHAAPHFAETAETALSLSRSFGPTDRKHQESRMVIDHASARAYLRGASESLHHAVKELDGHLDFHRFFPALTHRDSPAPPPPAPSGRHR
ncbi:hypothetical protein [Streptomyces sp. NPDC059928]|uniref:hypothetical protein n=1 Tax=unclassified Streptomyces TaxID=2593676 RepID=UPI003651EEF1